MRLWIMSDLHLEVTRGGDLPSAGERPRFDVMIIAGDLIPRMERGVSWLRERVPDSPVIYVPGNHEGYGCDVDRTVEKARQVAAGTNVSILQNDTVCIGNVTFAGATLWTDFDLLGDQWRAMRGRLSNERLPQDPDEALRRPLPADACSCSPQGVARGEGANIGQFAGVNADTDSEPLKPGIPSFRIAVNDRLHPGESFATIAHELGHIFCGHLGPCNSGDGKNEESGWPDRRSLGLAEREVEAEAVAFLVASRAGLTTGSAAYLKTHAERAVMKKIDIDLIVRAAARIERIAKIHYGSMAFNA